MSQYVVVASGPTTKIDAGIRGACAFVSEIWKKKQVNLSILRCYGESRHLHSSYRFVQLPFNASQVVTSQTSVFHNSLIASSIQQCKFFSFASSQTNENETAQPANKPEATMETNNASVIFFSRMASNPSLLGLAADSSALNFQIPPISIKLDRNNYCLWRTTIKSALETFELDSFVLSPDPPTETISTTDEAGVTTTKTNPDFTLWKKRDRFVLLWIRSTLSESSLAVVARSTSSHQAWVAIEKTYQAQTSARRMAMKGELQSLTKGSLSMLEYIERKRAIADSLAENLKPISTEDLIHYILMGLDSSYGPFITAYMVKDDPSSVDDLIGMLLQEEARLEQDHLRQSIPAPSSTSASPTMALHVHRPSTRNSTSSGSGFSMNQTPGSRSNDNRRRRPHCQLCNKPDKDDSRSQYGFAIYHGSNLISWTSRKQKVVARSSTESEYRALAYTAAELIWLKQLLHELHFPITGPPLLLCDNVETNNASQTEHPDKKVDSGATDVSQSVKKRRRGTKRTKFSDSDSDSENNLSRDELVTLLAKKKELLKKKHREMEIMQEKFLMSYAENNNIIERTKREAENSKKFAIQSFAKSLLDVADNLGRASMVVKDKFTKMDTSEDPTGALSLLKTLLEGVEMTEKQLAEVFKKFGVEKYDPVNEEFDPNRHNAVYQVQDPSKPPNTVAVVMKAGYMLHERIIRPAEVGVTGGVGMDKKERESRD
uniref:GrpE protein homolog n=1 Tax=Lactuca sativa TaxID=4236 RepID=A0A9R1UPD2_LACSA|nr:hypothetical protein LSAT_V11C800427270 [Lactuca sativa]